MIKEVPAKTILQKVSYDSSKWFGVNFNMNLYRGCSHGCIYCDSRSDCYGIENFDSVCVKKDAVELLSRELRGKKKKGVVAVGAMSDTYNPFEKEHRVTRKALALIAQNDFGIAIPTKSTLIERDIDLFQEIKRNNPVLLKLTITCADDNIASIVEPHAPSSSERFKTIETLSAAGLFTGILMMPILPFINDTERNLRGIVRRAKAVGAQFVSPSFGLTMRDGQREYYYNQLEAHYPGLKEKYRLTYGQRYQCDSHRAKSLYYAFRDECEKQGMRYRMDEIIKAYKKDTVPEQISLF